jgi:beta-phosphoglucomutase family hydrolase
MAATAATSSTPLLLPAAIRACLFDLDGVLTDTAKLHARAWKETFDDFLRMRAAAERLPFVPFDAVHDYDDYVDGRQRLDGVRSFLASRGIEAAPATVERLGGRKNDRVLDLIRRCGLDVFDGSVRFVRAARAAGLETAVVSGSANCRDVLEAAGIADLFAARVDGVVAAREQLPGKPAPDTYLAAARLLGVAPAEAAVFEDALAGVEAARAGAFGLVVGVDRVGQAEALRQHGADIVVSDLAELLQR